jgi:site-specific DNA-methyltransferase (adenine-specific)
MEKVPQLEQCKTKSDAMKLIKKWKGNIIDSEKAKAIREQKIKTTTDTRRKQIIDRFIVKDFFEGVKQLEEETVDLVEIDPPYGINLKDMKKHEGGDNVATLEYNEVDSFKYKKFMEDVLKECYRVMKRNSWIILWFGPEPWFEMMFTALEKAGFRGNRLAGIWYKGTGQTMQPDYYMANSYEMFFYARKGSPTLHKKGRVNVFEYPPVPPSKKIHPTERPLDMMEDVLDTFTGPGSTVLVPFLGSGNTILACDNKDMQGFGYELSQEYKDKFIIRVHEQVPGMFRL